MRWRAGISASSKGINGWLERWSAEVADLRGYTELLTSGRSIALLTNDSLRWARDLPYRYELVRSAAVANDALVAISAARYSVPVQVCGADSQRA